MTTRMTQYGQKELGDHGWLTRRGRRGDFVAEERGLTSAELGRRGWRTGDGGG